MLSKSTSIIRYWYWVWLISAMFVGVMVMFVLTRYPAWLHYSYRGLSLSHEMSYGVWWSAICLFLAAIVFANVGAAVERGSSKPWPWYLLAVGMLALAFDEVGSLHETVARVAGWQGLVPFGLVLGIGFGAALIELLRNPASRMAATLVIFGLGIFATVVGLEMLEHDYSFQHPFWRRARQVGEEASELVAMGLLITAGLVAMKRMGDPDRRVINATAIVQRLADYPLAVFILFILHSGLTVAVILPNYTFFPEGNPSALFPMLMFFCLGIMAAINVQKGESRWFWRILAILFIAASMSQLYNGYVLIENVFNPDPLHSPYFVNLFGFEVRVGRILAEPPVSWCLTLLPFLYLGIRKYREGKVEASSIWQPLMLLALLYLLVFPDLDLRFRLEYLYFLFSGAVAWSCYRLMVESEIS